jgi:hypothetical protein
LEDDAGVVLSPQEQAALAELEDLIRTHYPRATFSVEPDPEGQESIWLVTTVDIEDTEEVTDLVIERVLEFQLEQGLPIHVLPLRPIERSLAEFQSKQQAEKAAARAGAGD